MDRRITIHVLLFITYELIVWKHSSLFCAAKILKGRKIFEDNFDTDKLNESLWSREIKIPLDPDYEFCIYHKDNDRVVISNGILKIKPRIFEDAYGEDSVRIGNLQLADCTSSISQECHRQATYYHILPPVISAKLVTKNHFEFRYGVVEIRAKFSEGDWLFPEIWLEPVSKSCDSNYANARINLGLARGNNELSGVDDPSQDFGGSLLEFGVGNGTAVTFHEELVKKRHGGNIPWTKEFHTYRTTWSADGFTFHVDDHLVGSLVPTDLGWSTDRDAVADRMAPFDEKFYLSIGLGVGGIRVFPDETQTNSYIKPWKNINTKAMLLFWKAKDKWLPTWQKNGAKTALEIDYVRIWNLK